jgi:hypothetical protein
MIITHNKRRDGYAVVLMLGLVALLLAVVAANTGSVRALDRELKLLEKRQTARWTSPLTNTTPPAVLRP